MCRSNTHHTTTTWLHTPARETIPTPVSRSYIDSSMDELALSFSNLSLNDAYDASIDEITLLFYNLTLSDSHDVLVDATKLSLSDASLDDDSNECSINVPTPFKANNGISNHEINIDNDISTAYSYKVSDSYDSLVDYITLSLSNLSLDDDLDDGCINFTYENDVEAYFASSLCNLSLSDDSFDALVNEIEFSTSKLSLDDNLHDCATNVTTSFNTINRNTEHDNDMDAILFPSSCTLSDSYNSLVDEIALSLSDLSLFDDDSHDCSFNDTPTFKTNKGYSEHENDMDGICNMLSKLSLDSWYNDNNDFNNNINNNRIEYSEDRCNGFMTMYSYFDDTTIDSDDSYHIHGNTGIAENLHMTLYFVYIK
jgi:hypothetical protein